MSKVSTEHFTAEMTERFWGKVRPDADCWLWTARTTKGHGRFTPRNGSQALAHRVAYELLVGPIPTGLTLDHICRRRACVNPDHLEPTTMRVNVLRGQGITATLARRVVCKRGHRLSGENLLKTKDGSRQCKICKRLRRLEKESVSASSRTPEESGRGSSVETMSTVVGSAPRRSTYSKPIPKGGK